MLLCAAALDRWPSRARSNRRTCCSEWTDYGRNWSLVKLTRRELAASAALSISKSFTWWWCESWKASSKEAARLIIVRREICPTVLTSTSILPTVVSPPKQPTLRLWSHIVAALRYLVFLLVVDSAAAQYVCSTNRNATCFPRLDWRPVKMARVYADVNAQLPRSYWDYDSVNISWGVLENYEVVRKIGTSTPYQPSHRT